ncbi:hypothetical protein [Klebsiella aerogenes]|uniref:hypothetical protein n=1 Tax=Klebsiella aerogenes TaxID=548 RepID=UPI002FFC0FF3
MARKTIVFTVETDNRDKGKTFKITEMPARKAEEWAIQVACAVMGAGVSVPDDVMSAIGAAVAPAPAVEDQAALELYESVMASGMAGLAKWGLTSLAKVPFAQSKPLLDELLTCVKFVGGNGIETPLVDEGQIEEISTWTRLKIEAFKLHVAFVKATAN